MNTELAEKGRVDSKRVGIRVDPKRLPGRVELAGSDWKKSIDVFRSVGRTTGKEREGKGGKKLTGTGRPEHSSLKSFRCIKSDHRMNATAITTMGNSSICAQSPAFGPISSPTVSFRYVFGACSSRGCSFYPSVLCIEFSFRRLSRRL